ncbi:single-stranded DNA-binding protein [Parafannyhessea umbonata]|uniref:Single-stranded DNA-binding protein n=1 Tax=Parafannyhessea umbonata TaxID=604330 RepID=A0A1H1L2W3_9ACTN|nr:single-stranded DNA-binding protein [Parafannyhessea umbonata]SDR68866.1 single-strand DNA-binding protein [Parafannyhessea umbonata]
MSINEVAISGNLTRDPNVRKTASGSSVMNFSVAVNDRRKNQQSGEWEDYPNYVDCVLMGRRADSLAQYLSKGTKVSIAGKLHYSSWEKDGQKRSKLEVLVNEIEFMSRGNGGGGQYQQTQQYAQPQQQKQQSIYDDDSIPF